MVTMIRVIELGPFGCTKDRGTLESLEDIPKGYKAERMENRHDPVIVYVVPTRKDSRWEEVEERRDQ